MNLPLSLLIQLCLRLQDCIIITKSKCLSPLFLSLKFRVQRFDLLIFVLRFLQLYSIKLFCKILIFRDQCFFKLNYLVLFINFGFVSGRCREVSQLILKFNDFLLYERYLSFHVLALAALMTIHCKDLIVLLFAEQLKEYISAYSILTTSNSNDIIINVH